MNKIHENSEDDGWDRTVEMEQRGIISIDPKKMGGVPCIRDTRLAAGRILLCLSSGQTFEEIIESYKHLAITREDICAALEYGGWRSLNLEITSY